MKAQEKMVEDMLAQRKEEMLEEMLKDVQGENHRRRGEPKSFGKHRGGGEPKCIATYTSSNLKHFNFFGSFGWKEGLMDLRCKSQHVRTRQTMLRSGSAVFPGTAGKHSASAASGRQTSKEDPQRDNWKTLFESLF